MIPVPAANRVGSSLALLASVRLVLASAVSCLADAGRTQRAPHPTCPHAVRLTPPAHTPCRSQAYPGTMVVGDAGSVVNGSLQNGMTLDETRVHFGGWCIVSSPLILAYNMSEPARREASPPPRRPAAPRLALPLWAAPVLSHASSAAP